MAMAAPAPTALLLCAGHFRLPRASYAASSPSPPHLPATAYYSSTSRRLPDGRTLPRPNVHAQV